MAFHVAAAEHEKTGKKEALAPKTNRVTFLGAYTDGEKVFAEIDVFDGEHTHKMKPTFDGDVSAKEIMEYMKKLVEKSPVLKAEIAMLQDTLLYWDQADEGFYTKVPAGKPQRLDKEKD